MRASLLMPLLMVALSGVGGFWVGRRSGEVAVPPSVTFPEDTEPTIARWSGGRLTVSQLQARVVALKTASGVAVLDPAIARTLSHGVIQTALLATEARQRGLERDPRVEGPVAELLARRMMEVDLEAARRPATDAEVTAYYEAHREDFVRPERIRLAVVQNRAPRGNERARARAKVELEALRQALTSTPAAALSEALAKQGAFEGAFTRAELETRLGAESAQASWLLMNLGRFEVLETEDSVLLARLDAREPESSLTPGQARAQIESRLWYAHRDQVLAQQVEALRQKLKLEIDEGALTRALADVR